MTKYRQFIQSLIKENEVLDKKFYVILTVSSLELGVIKKTGKDYVKGVQNVLLPRRDQIIRLLLRVGLKAIQPNTQALTSLFFFLYNGQENGYGYHAKVEPVNLRSSPKATSTMTPVPTTENPPIITGYRPINDGQKPKNHPFVVEELADNP